MQVAVAASPTRSTTPIHHQLPRVVLRVTFTGGHTDAFEQMLAAEKEARAATLNMKEQRKQELRLLQV